MSSLFSKWAKSALLTPEPIYNLYLKNKFGSATLRDRPKPSHPNAVLQTAAEWQKATDEARALHLPLHRDPQKNWDHVEAAAIILDNTSTTDPVLDAGSELYSNVLPILYLAGYRSLYGMNLGFKFTMRRGPIRYLRGDITQTGFPANHFGGISCLSVIEHGVPIREYFAEMWRVLKSGGVLITSTDYFPTAIDTRGQSEHGAEIKVFTRAEIEQVLAIATSIGFELTSPLSLESHEKAVRWAEKNLEYTFVMFTLRKR